MKTKQTSIFGIIALLLTLVVLLTGCSHDTGDGGKPGKLSYSATYNQALDKLDEIIVYCSNTYSATNSAIKSFVIQLMGEIDNKSRSEWWRSLSGSYIVKIMI